MDLKSAIGNYLRVRPALGAVALRCIPDIRWNIRIEPIGRVMIRLRRNRSFWLRDPLTHEWKVFGLINRLVRKGNVVYDVGSNIGVYARFLVRCFGAAQVIGFEPMTENYDLLLVNLRTDKIVSERVRALKIALSDTDGHADLQIDDVGSSSAALDSVTGGQASAGRRQFGMAPRTERVSVRVLDHLLPEEKLPPPDVIKIDIEGAAALALRGAIETLQKYRPRLIVELHGASEGLAVWDIVQPLGYRCFGYIERDGAGIYAELLRSDIRDTADFWQPHFLVASHDLADVIDPIPPATPDEIRLTV